MPEHCIRRKRTEQEAAMNEREFEHEQRYLSETLGTIDTEMRELDSRLTDGIEAANEEAEEAIIKELLQRLRVLGLIKDKPYFARVDFQAGGGAAENLYIGKSTVLDAEDRIAVIDWRAPISTLYYEGRIGEASYECPDGIISGIISLKRQLEIENRRLMSYSDIDITFDEELLKPYLAVGSNTRLKNIIATIQAEQNRIIRAGLRQPLIVQGVAGSGKTTVALHRIAYLIYATGVKPEQFLIIAPNALFLDYISGVLPDLGVENVNQKTFDAFAQEFIGKRLKTEDPGDKLARILDGRDAEMEMRASSYKASLRFHDMIDRYLGELEKVILPREHFCIGKYPLMSYENIFSLFTEEMAGRPFAKRVDLLKERLKAIIAEQAGVPAIFAETSSPSRLADALAAEGTDVDVVELYTESLGPAGSAGDTYVHLLMTDAERIAAALGPRS
jgi:DNA helicase-2/ATP-dependent DNA helicase PcrA